MVFSIFPFMFLTKLKEIAKKALREPLFYVLPLLAILYLIAVPAKMEISDVKITRDEITENIKLPYLVAMAAGEVFIISYDLSVKNKKDAKFNVIPDDCIEEILINGETFPLDGINGLCDYSKGAYFDFSKYVKEGLNHFEFRIKNSVLSPAGLNVKIPYKVLRSISLTQHIFILLFLFLIVLILKKLKVSKETIFACVLSFPFVIYAFVELCLRINYELSGVYTWDTTIYWAVGRGIVNGIAPWSGLFDIKPPGMHLLSAFSFKFFDSSVFTNFFQVLVLILTAATPTVAYFLLSSHRSAKKLAFSLLAGLMLALYSAERSGEVQIESFGAAFACMAVLAMAMPNFEKRRILWTSLAAIGLLGACGFKEPFLFPLFGVSLIFCKDIKDWFYRFALPLAIAVAVGVLILLICGWLGGFLQYLEFMSSTHISRYGSPFRRAMDFSHLYNDMNAFSWGLAIAVFALLSLPFIKANSKSDEYALFTKIIFLGAAFFLTNYSVGLGGEYYNHHHVFALPFYMALVLFLLKEWNGESSGVAKLGLASFVFFAIATLNLPNLNFDGRSEYLNNSAKEPKLVADYLDSKMNELNIDRYAFIGFNGPEIYGWTKHSPMGPYFIQDPRWFSGIPNFGDSLISIIEKSDIVVVSNMWKEIAPQANRILAEQFTKQRVNKYEMYFRKNKIGVP